MKANSARRYNVRPIWLLASAAELVAAILHSVEGEYLRAAPMYSLAVAFLLLANTEKSKNPRLAVGLACAFVVVGIGLIVYRFAA